MVNMVIAFIMGGVIGVLACYAWMKGFYQDIGGK